MTVPDDLTSWMDQQKAGYMAKLRAPKQRGEAEPKAKRRGSPEMDLQKRVVAMVRRSYPSIVIAAVQNEKGAWSQDPTQAARYGMARKASGVLPGFPDIIMALPGGRTIYLELKAPKGSLSPAQHLVHARLRDIGHRVHVVRSVEEVQFILHDAGVYQPRPVQPL